MRPSVLLLLLSTLAAGAAVPVELTRGEDIFGRPVAAAFRKGLPVFVLLANRETQAATESAGAAISVNVAPVHFVTLVRADLRDVFSMFHGMARRSMRGSYDEVLARNVNALKERGLPVVADPKSLFLETADDDGEVHAAFGLPEGFTEALAIVYDKDGHEIARGAYPREAKKIEDAIREAAKLP